MFLHLAKAFRVLMVAPVMALVMLLILYIRVPSVFGSPLFFAAAVLFLTVLPLLGYPLQPLFPHFREKGREGQRTLAMIFAVAGYIAGCGLAFFTHAPGGLKVIFLSYLFSGALVVLFNKLLHLRASGHACGVAGPFAILACFGQWASVLGVPILAVVWWSSLKTHRHTAGQLAAGTVIPLAGLLAAVLLFPMR